MKTKLILSITLLITFFSYSQSLYKSSIDSGGASVSVGNLQVLFTLGEVAVQETTVDNTSVSEGFIDTIISGTLSINENFWNDNIVVYPNPTSSNINISSKAIIDGVEIYDAQGKKVLSANFQKQIDISNLNSGLYLIKLYSGESQMSKKLIIK